MTYYDEIAASYKELHKSEQLNKLRIIKENVTLNNNIKILDVGCGPCWSADLFDNVTGIDPSLGLLKGHDNVVQGVAEHMPFKDHEFDLVMSVTAMHHFDVDKAIDEMKRVGKESFVVSVLKKAQNSELIMQKLQKHFTVINQIEEEKDTIYFLGCR